MLGLLKPFFMNHVLFILINLLLPFITTINTSALHFVDYGQWNLASRLIKRFVGYERDNMKTAQRVY